MHVKQPSFEPLGQGTLAASSMTPRRRLSLRSGVAYVYASNLVYVAAQWCILLVMARQGGAALAGQYIYALALVSPVFMFTSFRLRSLQATDVKRLYSFGHYLALILLGNVLAMALTVGLTLMVADTPTRLVVLLIGLNKSIEAVVETLYGWFQQHERLDLLAVSRTVHGLIQATAFASTYLITGNIYIALGACVLTRTVVGLGCDVGLLISADPVIREQRQVLSRLGRLIRLHRPLFHFVPLKSLLFLSAPLAVMVLLTSLLNNCPKYFLAYFESDAKLGVFGGFVSLLTAGATVTRAVDQASCTRLAQLHTDGRRGTMQRLLLAILCLYAAMSLVFIAVSVSCGPVLIDAVLGPEFAEDSHVLNIVLMSGMLSYAAGLVDNALIAVRRTVALQRLVFLSAVAMVALCAVLIPHYGLVGAAASLGLAKLPLVCGGMYVLLRKDEPAKHAAEMSANAIARDVGDAVPKAVAEVSG